MDAKLLLADFVDAVEEIVGDPWSGETRPRIGREAVHPPVFFPRSFAIRQFFYTMGLHAVTFELIFVAGATDSVSADDELLSLLSTDDVADADGRLARIAALQSPVGRWNSAFVPGCRIVDEYVLGQQAYRAAVLDIQMLAPHQTPDPGE